jgi:hypothetical protein
MQLLDNIYHPTSTLYAAHRACLQSAPRRDGRSFNRSRYVFASTLPPAQLALLAAISAYTCLRYKPCPNWHILATTACPLPLAPLDCRWCACRCCSPCPFSCLRPARQRDGRLLQPKHVGNGTHMAGSLVWLLSLQLLVFNACFTCCCHHLHALCQRYQPWPNLHHNLAATACPLPLAPRDCRWCACQCR